MAFCQFGEGLRCREMADELQTLPQRVVDRFNQSAWVAEDLASNDAHGLFDASHAFVEQLEKRITQQGVEYQGKTCDVSATHITNPSVI